MQIETTISTLYNVKKCLEEKLDSFSITKNYSVLEIRDLKVRENHLKEAEIYNLLFDKYVKIEDQIHLAIFKL